MKNLNFPDKQQSTFHLRYRVSFMQILNESSELLWKKFIYWFRTLRAVDAYIEAIHS